MKRARLGAGSKSLERGSTFKVSPVELRRSRLARRSGMAASASQQEAVRDCPCIVCARQPADPAHLVDRSLADDGMGDPRAVVPLDRECHRAYDEGGLDLLPYLEPFFREQLAFAVKQYGLLRTLERVTNRRWRPEDRS